ncbi:MAG TPA: glycosyltransferase family 2 protein [Anaerolineales bacterium]|nr:glycosyltransferase family 2 protein [Anaerolineales bacterium]
MEAKTPHPIKVVVVVPAYNEARFIGSTVIKAINQTGCVIVIDDGSQDDTAEIARAAGAIVIQHAGNRGKGAALNTGLQAGRRFDPQAVVLLDADGQHRPEEMARLLEPIFLDQADIVVGSRYGGKKSCVPGARILGHRLFNLITRLVSGESVSDSQCGYRAFSARALEIVSFCSQGFSVESEMQFLAHEYGLRIQEVDITVLYPDKPKRPLLFHGMLVLNGIIKLTGQYRPLLSFGLFGMILFLVGSAFSIRVLEVYLRTQDLAVVPALLSIALAFIGLTLWMTGFTLHSVRGMLRDILKTWKP